MENCFVIQPFDKGKYDSRFTDIFEPAIRASGLNAYRVDRDPSVKIPIDQIEEGIRTAQMCFAEITTDNPNVWYELGYAFASNTDVVMVCCSDERIGNGFPFDIQHRHIIRYKTSSKSDYDALEKSITEKMIAFISKQGSIAKLISNPVKSSEGLEQHEVTMLIVLLENQLISDDSVAVSELKNYMEQAGFTAAATGMALRVLTKKGFVESSKLFDFNHEYNVCKLTEYGESWLMTNQDKIQFHISKEDMEKRNKKTISSDDLPF